MVVVGVVLGLLGGMVATESEAGLADALSRSGGGGGGGGKGGRAQQQQQQQQQHHEDASAGAGSSGNHQDLPTNLEESWEILSKNLMWENTFRAPFSATLDENGDKAIDGWSVGGAAKVLTNFIRLTPDKASKTGWVFNSNPTTLTDWTALIRFRVSGRNERMGGDGLAVWFTDTNVFRGGSLFGHTDTFRGIGIIFDTFANDDGHKDVMVVAGNGQDPVTIMGDEFPGCSSHFRMWEGAPGFSVEKDSLAKISLNGTRVTVEVDESGTGDWVKCVDHADMAKWLEPREGVPEIRSRRGGKGGNAQAGKRSATSWKQSGRFYITAATGALSDNHDVMDFIVARPAEFHRVMAATDHEETTPIVQVDTSSDHVDARVVGAHVNDLSFALKEVDDRLKAAHHEFEHKIETVSQHLEQLINDLKKQETGVEQRVQDLEKRLSQNVQKNLQDRLAELERRISEGVEHRTRHIETRVKQEVEQSSSGWRWPFFFFAVVVVGTLAYITTRVRKIDARDKRLY